MRKCLILKLAALSQMIVLAGDPVQVSTTAELVAALTAHNGTAGQVIELAANDYILPSEPMITDANNGYGAICVNNVTLRGLGARPEDVKLIGDGRIRAVLGVNSGRLENLMVTNGNTTAGYTPPGQTKPSANSTRGGGVYGPITITNCVIAGCKGSHGGGVASCTKLLDSRLCGNTATWGGAVFGMSFSGCTLANNTSGEGGGAWLNGKYEVRDSVFVGNAATGNDGGGIFQQGNVTVASNCVFSGNSAVNGGGGAAFGRAADATARVELYDCIVTNNTAKNGGACSKCTIRGGLVARNGASANGGGLHDSSAFACSILDNTAKAGGGCHGSDLHDRCVVSGNVVMGGSGGGGLYASSAYDCVVSNNFANGSFGGGVYNDADQVISNCLVYANRCSSGTGHAFGGGIYCASSDARIIDCEVTGNYAMTAPDAAASSFGLTGGVHRGTILGGSVHDNYADSLCGGCREGTAIGCRIYNNDSGDNGKNCHSMRLIGCDVSDNLVSYGSAYGCVFHDIVDGRSHTLTNNPFKADHTYSTVAAVWNYHVNATNCLFRGNKTTLFMGTNAGKVRASLVNCTVTDNEIGYTFHTFKDPDYQLDVVNSAFVGNRNKLGQACDIAMASAVDDEGRYGISLRNCLYGSTSVANLADFAPNPATLYRLGEGGIASAPLFKGSGAYPYEPKWSSPLVGRGMLMDWMTAAYDIRGDISAGKYRRLRDGKVDIGCYQSWLEPTGLVVLLQ